MIEPENRETITRLLIEYPTENIPSEYLPLLYKGAVDTLLEDGSAESIILLTDAATSSFSDQVKSLSTKALVKLATTGDEQACDSVYRLVIFSDSLDAQQAITQYDIPTGHKDIRAVFNFLNNNPDKYRAIDPDFALITGVYRSGSQELRDRLAASAALNEERNWIEIVHTIEAGDPETIENVVNHFSHYNNHEQNFVRILFPQLIAENKKGVLEAFCELVIRYDDQKCKEIALKNGYLPQDKIQRALFLFLTEQWEAYEKEDFSHRLLTTAYEEVPSFLRKKILMHSRQTGYTVWMKGNIGELSRLRSITDLTDADWQMAYTRLCQKKAYGDIWSLAQSAPPIWSSYFLSGLPEDWQPLTEDNDAFFRNIRNLAKQCQEHKLMQPEFIQITTQSEIHCVAVNPDNTFFACGDAQGEVSFWLLASGQPFASYVKSPVPHVRAIAISPDNNFIACANQDHQIRIFRISDGKLLKTISGHRGFIRSLLFDPAGHMLFSASFDGSIYAWRFPQGTIRWQHTPNQGEIFCMDSSRDGNWLIYASSSQTLDLIQSVDGKNIRSLQEHTGQATLVASTPSGSIAAGYTNDKKIHIWNLRSGKKTTSFSTDPYKLTVLVLHPQEQIILGATLNGEIVLWSVSNGTQLHHWKAHQDMIVDLKLNNDGNLLVSAAKSGDIKIWKLNALHLAFQSISSYEPSVLSQIAHYQAEKKINQTEKIWLEYIQRMLQWRQRYEIEISTPAIIEMGEFDIEL